MKSIILMLAVIMMITVTTPAHAYDAGVRTLIKGSANLTTDSSITYRGFFPNLTKSVYSIQYVGITKKLADWVGVEGIIGSTAATNGKNSQVLRGDVWFAYDRVTTCNFTEWYVKYHTVGISNNIDVKFDRFHAGAESYTYLVPEGKNAYSYGPFVGVELNKNLRLNLMHFLHGKKIEPTTLFSLSLLF